MGQLTYTTQEVQDRLDAVGTLVRPNLLDNAYFIGGGSQQGGSQFPINQRGQTTYTGAGYKIDRWLSNYTADTLDILSGGVKYTINSTSTGRRFHQPVEAYGMEGQTLTFSALVLENVGTAKSLYLACFGTLDTSTTALAVEKTTLNGTGIFTVSIVVPSGTVSLRACLYKESGGSTGDYITFAAMKLEAGDSQTLAHQENGVWVLNEIPNYEVELAKCQRYLLTADYNGKSLFEGFGVVQSSGAVNFFVPVPVTMRAVPAITNKCPIRIVYGGSSYDTSNYTAWIAVPGLLGFQIDAISGMSAPAHTVVSGTFWSGTKMFLSADL